MRAVDTNILVYSQLATLPEHERAHRLLKDLATGRAPWAIPWPCVHEYLRVITHPRMHHPTLPVRRATAELAELLASPSLLLLQETPDHLDYLNRAIEESGASGNLIHDAHIAALCHEHGVSELITADRDFARFPSLKIHNPFA
jgi:toxin-antitoxin system PIN domain toxin